MEKQLKLFFWNNQNLFSNNYLEHRLPYTSLWSEQKEKAKTAFDLIKKSYESIKDLHLGPGQEKELEDKFIRPVLNALDFTYHVEPVTKRGYKKKRPDFALFEDMKSYRSASSVRDHPEKFFSQALTILESKYWGRRLNDTDKSDVLDSRDPTAQTVKYLDDVHFHTNGKINWAILTNGKHWRLFYYRAASRSGNFFEVDLEEIIINGNIEEFLYFYLFFSRDAFITDPPTGKTWLDQHLKGTEEYAVRVSTKLKDLIFDKVFEGLAEGFVHFRRYELSIQDETDGSRKNIFKGCLTLLYRLLFLLYAESRNLLPVQEPAYYKAGLLNLKKDIYHDISTLGLEKMSKKSYSYWSRLESLFDIVAKGDSALNVPIYNGGLFETSRDNFLSTHKMSDPFLAEAIKLLTVDHEGEYRPDTIPFIDYSSLNVRHLGDIYEGLLEFHVQIAEEDIVAVRKEGKSLWVKAAEVKEKTKISEKKKKGEVYIENSKHERKASGSYYTPHYIVGYIVKNTVGPVLEERLKTAGELLLELDEAYKTLHKQRSTVSIQGYRARIKGIEDSIFNTLFNIKVLDPAMGSGHFLVHTVDFISDRIISFLANYPENPVIRKIAQLKNEILQEITQQGVRIDERKLTEVNLIKRMVMKRCIYGVDLNDMAVELAKLSLWLDSFTLGAPLSFLDHHLKCGNSLIGTNIDGIEKALAGHLFAINLEPLKRAIRDMIFVSDLPDATLAQVRESYEKFGEVNKGLEGYRILLDMLIAEYFGIPEAKKLLVSDFDKIDLNRLWESIRSLPEDEQKLIERVKRASDKKRFFHWEIEFPEVFYEQKSEFGQKIDKKENPGFDCVIGNPPYDVLSELEQERIIEPEKEFYKKNQLYSPAVSGKINYYRLFSVLSLDLLRKYGEHGFIVPMALLADKQAKALREFILKKYYLHRIEAFPQKDDPTNRVFPEAKLSTCIYILKKENPSLFSIRIHPGKDIMKTSTSLSITPSQIEKFDKENLSIPSYPNMTTEDFHLALKLKRVSKGITLKHFASSQQGEVNLTEHAEFLINKDKGRIILRGAHINRYEFQEEPKQGEPIYLDVKRFLDTHGKGTKAYDYRYTRIGYQRGSAIDNWRRIIATTIEKDNFCSDTVNYIVTPKEYNLFAILALLNSALWEWRFRLTSTNNHVNSYEIDSMSMPPIFFTTPQKERKEFFKEAVNLYKGSEYEDILKWAAYELALKRNDTIHDFLAYLAEQMIELNKRKNEEIKGFLKWLEHEIGAEIDTLTNKTAIKEYHDNDFNSLLDVLKKNKNKISVDPSNRKTQELLEKHFTKSMLVLEPLKGKIKNTDNLIDRIVYKLYGLTDEEIELVEGKG
jgi:Alw26I/Eco31I/Esp3I family type II restriction m6 adenine DNA methyltransferase